MELRDKFLAVEKELNEILIERNAPIRGAILATLSGTNLLLLGPAGVGKSLLINEWNKRITDSKYFSWLLTKYSTPEELFGIYSLKGLEEERYYRVTKNKMPEAQTVFLDEVFKGNSSILNALLTVLNERIFYNDGVPVPLNIVTIAGASNEIPDADDGLDAFFDRFLLKYQIKSIQDPSNFARLLTMKGKLPEPRNTISLGEIHEAQEQIGRIELPPAVMEQIIKIRESIREKVTSVSDRTFRTSIRILQADAWLRGSKTIESSSIELFQHICWAKPEQIRSIQSLILELIAPEKNKVMTLYNEIKKVVKEVYKQTDGNKRQNAVLDAAQKIKEARTQIAQLRRTMEGRGADVTEVEAIEKELVQENSKMARDLLGVDLTGLEKK